MREGIPVLRSGSGGEIGGCNVGTVSGKELILFSNCVDGVMRLNSSAFSWSGRVIG